MTKAIKRIETVTPVARVRGRAEVRREVVSEFLEFGLAEERFALPLPSIHEIMMLAPISEVPRAPADVLGIISVRGRITTVIDLRRRLGLPPAEGDPRSRILLVDGGGGEILGLLVDVVHGVQRLEEDEIELAATVAGDLSEHVYGIGRPRGPGGEEEEGEIMVLLDPEPLLRR